MQRSFFASNVTITDNHVKLTRPHIHNLLIKALQCPLVTVVAGAGYGKTHAVYSFLHEYTAINLWLQLSDFDNLVERFWENFTKTIARRNAVFAAKLETLGLPESERQFDRYLTLLKSEIEPDRRYIIVLDDFHLIQKKLLLQFMVKSILTQPPNVSVIVISRTEPEINLISLLAKGLVFQINENDLRFKKEEMIEYFKLLDITLPPQVASDVYISTDGWVFAIHLMGLSLKNGLKQKDYALSAMKVNIFKLIEAEIFSVASKALQRFLIQLSLIDHLSPDLLKQLTSDERLLAEISKITSFLRYDAYTNTYRIHHLFLEYLCQKQDLLTYEEKQQVYIKAAQWCIANDYKMDAITYYEKAGNYKGIVETAYPLTRMTPSRVAEFLLGVLEKIPEQAFRENVELYIIQNKSLQSLARFEEAFDQASATIKIFETLPPTKINCWLLSECYLNLGFIGVFTSLYTNHRDHSHHFEKAYHYFQLSSKMVKGPRERALISSYVCRVGYPAKRGEIERGNEIFSHYVSYAIKIKNGMMHGVVDLAYCEIAYFKADLKKAEGLAYQAVSKAREAEQFQIENRALLFLLRIHLYRGNSENIRNLFQQLDAQLEKKEFLNRYTLYDIVTGWFFAHIRQVDKIANWLKSDFEKSDLNSLLYGLENLVRAKYCLVEKRYHAVLASLEGQDNRYGLEAFLLGKLEVMALRAVCLYHVGDKTNAINTLYEAYNISLTDDLDMPFIELGKDMRTLTAAAMKETHCSIPRQWLEKINKKASAYAKNLSYVISEYRNFNQLNDKLYTLTSKEKEILSDLCHGLSRTEIAFNRNLSVNTVKMLIQTIYAKLGAQNTADAIWTAATLKLIE